MIKKEYNKPEVELMCFDDFIRTSLEENETRPVPFTKESDWGEW